MIDEFQNLKGITETVEKLAHKVNANVVHRLIEAYLLSEDCAEKKELFNDIGSILSVHASKMLFSDRPIITYPSQALSDGSIRIGKVVHDGIFLWDFRIQERELNAHMLITARSGHGKTTLIINLMRELLKRRIPFMIFDFKKDYRHLVRLYPQLVVLSWRNLRINLLQPPPGVSFNSWKQQVLNIFGHIFGVWHGSINYLLQAIDEVYEEKGRIPRISEVYGKIAEANEKSRKMLDYASTVEVRLYGLLSRLGSSIDRESTEINVEKLLEMPVIIELHDLGRDEQNLIALWFFYWIYAYRRENNMRERLMHVLIIDEAKRIFTASEAYSQTTAEFSGIPPAELILDEIRSYGEGLIMADQEPSKLSNAVKANTYTKICGFLGNGRDIDDMAQAMNLNHEEREVLSHLERGEWIVKLAGRYTRPFLIRTEDFPLEKNVSDEELAEIMKPKLEELYKHVEIGMEMKYKTESKHADRLSGDEWTLLLNINYHPFLGIAERARNLNLPVKRLEEAKRKLLSKGLIGEVEISLTGRRPKLFLTLTEKSLELLKRSGINIQLWERIGRVGFEHLLYQILLRRYLRKLGFRVYVEEKIGNRRIDILASDGRRRIGFEIELNPNANPAEKAEVLKFLETLYIVTRGKDYPVFMRRFNGMRNVIVCPVDELLQKLHNLLMKGREINPVRGNKLKSTIFYGNKNYSRVLGRKGDGNFGKNQGRNIQT